MNSKDEPYCDTYFPLRTLDYLGCEQYGYVVVWVNTDTREQYILIIVLLQFLIVEQFVRVHVFL